jgi:phosphoribosyl-AMP cyclohydrolase
VRKLINEVRDPSKEEDNMISSSQGDADRFTHALDDYPGCDRFFYRESTIADLGNELSIFVDNTYKTVPTEYSYCLSILAFESETEAIAPLFHVLSNRDETKESLVRHLSLFKTLVASRTRIAEVMVDFDKALIGAVQEVYPESKVLGCGFHYAQAVRRAWEKRHGRYPSQLHEAVWTLRNVLDRCELITLMKGIVARHPDIKELENFMDGYFLRTWTKVYPIPLWCHDGPFRTNNPVETFHAALKDSLGGKARSTLLFREALRTLYDSWWQDFSVEAKRRRARKREQSLRRRLRRNPERIDKKKPEKPRQRGPYHCGICGDPSHTRKICPQLLTKGGQDYFEDTPPVPDDD